MHEFCRSHTGDVAGGVCGLFEGSFTATVLYVVKKVYVSVQNIFGSIITKSISSAADATNPVAAVSKMGTSL